MASSSMKKQQQRSIEFPVPQQLKQAPMHVKRIAIEDDSFVIEHKRQGKIDGEIHDHIKFTITGKREEDMTELRKWAKNNFFFIDNPDQFMIDELVNYVGALYVDGAARTIAKIKERNEAEAKKQEEREGQRSK
jgi:hypothetical protein